MSPVRKSAFLLALFTLIGFSFGQAAPKPAKPAASAAAFDKPHLAELLVLLKSDKPSEVSAAKSDIKAVIGSNKLAGVKSLVADILPKLQEAKKYDTVEELAKYGIIMVPYSPETLLPAFQFPGQSHLP